MIRKGVFIVFFLLTTSFIWAGEFSIDQLNTMAGCIGKDMRKLPYTFQVYKGKIKDIGYNHLSQSSKGGSIFGIGSYAIGQALWVDTGGTVFSARWVMDGTSTQEMEEYRSILLLLEKHLGKTSNSTATSASWEWKGLGVYTEFKDEFVGVAVFNLKKKTLVQTLFDIIF